MKKLLLLLFCLTFLLNSCKKDKETEPSEYKREAADVLPQNNSSILEQRFYGNADGRYSLYSINDTKTFFYFHATSGQLKDTVFSSENIVGKMDYSGNVLSDYAPGITVRGVTYLPVDTGKYAKGLVFYGKTTSTPSRAILMVSEAENLNQTFNITNVEIDTWFNSIIVKNVIGNLITYIAIGGKTINNVYFPYLCEIQVDIKDKSITKTSSKIFNEYSNQIFKNIKSDENSNGNFYCTIGNYNSNKNEQYFSVACLTSQYNVTWKTDVRYNSELINSVKENIIVCNSKIYTICNVEDTDKPLTSEGKKWESGLVTCLNMQGQQQWQTKIKLSNYNENLTGITDYNGYIYIVGEQGEKYRTKNSSSKWCYGNALLVKLDASNGSIINSNTFGDGTYASGFNSVSIVNANIYCVGYAKYEQTKGGYMGWFVKLAL